MPIGERQPSGLAHCDALTVPSARPVGIVTEYALMLAYGPYA